MSQNRTTAALEACWTRMGEQPIPAPFGNYSRAPRNNKGGYLNTEDLWSEEQRRRAAAWGPFLPVCSRFRPQHYPAMAFCVCGHHRIAHGQSSTNNIERKAA